MAERSNSPSVRNPVLKLPGVRRLQDLSPDARAALAEVLGDIRADARTRAETSWHRHKALMAAYWKAVSVYAGHIQRGSKQGGQSSVQIKND